MHVGLNRKLNIQHMSHFVTFLYKRVLRLFWRDPGHVPTAIWNYILYTESRKSTCW